MPASIVDAMLAENEEQMKAAMARMEGNMPKQPKPVRDAKMAYLRVYKRIADSHAS